MSENLEEMLRRAQTAEQTAGKTKQEEETQVKQQSEADLEASLKERESLLGEAGKTEQERAKAAELLEKGKELTAGKEKLTAEMEEFMRVAVNSVQERETQLAALNKQLETIEANPAVIDRLREQAEEENRRIELQKEVSKGFWIKPQGKENGGSMYSALSKSKEYTDNVEGRHSGDSALVQLESYAMHASGMMKGEEVVVPLDEAEDVVRRWSEIRQEAESGNPDIQKVDNSIIGKTLECLHQGECNEQCTEAFKIITEELQFYKNMNLSLPKLCPNCRHYKRFKQRNPWKLWRRSCMCEKQNHFHGAGKCEVEFETSYAPDRSEIIYCEKCYQQEVY